MKKELNALTMQRRLSAARLNRFASPIDAPEQEAPPAEAPQKKRRKAVTHVAMRTPAVVTGAG